MGCSSERLCTIFRVSALYWEGGGRRKCEGAHGQRGNFIKCHMNWAVPWTCPARLAGWEDTDAQIWNSRPRHRTACCVLWSTRPFGKCQSVRAKVKQSRWVQSFHEDEKSSFSGQLCCCRLLVELDDKWYFFFFIAVESWIENLLHTQLTHGNMSAYYRTSFKWSKFFWNMYFIFLWRTATESRIVS